jgi:hypothetical protein
MKPLLPLALLSLPLAVAAEDRAVAFVKQSAR